MAMTDMAKKESQRAAYAAYVESYWRWARLALGDPARATLAEVTRRAEARWRALMLPAVDVVLDVSPVAGTSAVVERAAPTANREPVDAVSRSTISLSAWGD